MLFFPDQTGSIIQLDKTPKRIVSLVPSQTELLHYLGLNQEVVGITKFCVHPAGWLQTKTKVGGTKNVRIEIVHQLQPDLIIANKEENVKEQIEELREHFPVWVSDVNNLEDALNMIKSVGSMTDTLSKAVSLINEIQSGFSRLSSRLQFLNANPLTAYLIWRNPYMVAGGDTFIHAMMRSCGFKNIYESVKRYPLVTVEELKAANCQLLLLSTEPYPFQQKHLEELQEQLTATIIILVDGEPFSWYGSRLLQASCYFEDLLEKIFDRPFPSI